MEAIAENKCALHQIHHIENRITIPHLENEVEFIDWNQQSIEFVFAADTPLPSNENDV